MKLLLDQNLSRRLCPRLAEAFGAVDHVADFDLAEALDAEVWAFAEKRGYVVVSKDHDFRSLALREGPPPKAVVLELGNCRSDEIVALLLRRREAVAEFVADAEAALLVIQ